MEELHLEARRRVAPERAVRPEPDVAPLVVGDAQQPVGHAPRGSRYGAATTSFARSTTCSKPNGGGAGTAATAGLLSPLPDGACGGESAARTAAAIAASASVRNSVASRPLELRWFTKPGRLSRATAGVKRVTVSRRATRRGRQPGCGRPRSAGARGPATCRTAAPRCTRPCPGRSRRRGWRTAGTAGPQ